MQVGGDASVSVAEQRRQVQALHALGFALDTLVAEGDAAVANGRVAEGLVFKLYHPNSDVLRTIRVLEPDLSAHLCGPSKVHPHASPV